MYRNLTYLSGGRQEIRSISACSLSWLCRLTSVKWGCLKPPVGEETYMQMNNRLEMEFSEPEMSAPDQVFMNLLGLINNQSGLNLGCLG